METTSYRKSTYWFKPKLAPNRHSPSHRPAGATDGKWETNERIKPIGEANLRTDISSGFEGRRGSPILIKASEKRGEKGYAFVPERYFEEASGI